LIGRVSISRRSWSSRRNRSGEALRTAEVEKGCERRGIVAPQPPVELERLLRQPGLEAL
jgi:hypothetical protein